MEFDRKSLIKYYPDFLNEFEREISLYEKENDWKSEPLTDQEVRTLSEISDIVNEYGRSGKQINWARIAVLSFVCWVREFEFEQIKIRRSKRAIPEKIDKALGKPLQPLIKKISKELKKRTG